LSKKWRVFQAVHVKPLITPLGSKICYIDMGVRNLATVWLPEWRQPVAYKSGRLLADWWYWKKRFRHAVAAFARQFIKDIYSQGASTVVIGELTGIRNNNNHGRQGNAMVHNYWSHKYVADRLKWTAEEYDMKIRTVSEAYTSQTCPRCGSRHSPHAWCTP
jgi:putative transposase